MSETITWNSAHGFDCSACGHSQHPCEHWKIFVATASKGQPAESTLTAQMKGKGKRVIVLEIGENLAQRLLFILKHDGHWDGSDERPYYPDCESCKIAKRLQEAVERQPKKTRKS
jgi:hypothetical protein